MIQRFEDFIIEVDLPNLVIEGLGEVKRKALVRDIHISGKEGTISLEVYIVYLSDASEVLKVPAPEIRTLITDRTKMVFANGEVLGTKTDLEAKDEAGTPLYGKTYMPQHEWYFKMALTQAVTIPDMVKAAVLRAFSV